LNKKPERCI